MFESKICHLLCYWHVDSYVHAQHTSTITNVYMQIYTCIKDRVLYGYLKLTEQICLYTFDKARAVQYYQYYLVS